jgi:hypothetical protein
MVDVARNTVATCSQYSRNMGGGRRPPDIWMLRAICSQHCSQWLATCSQHLLHSLESDGLRLIRSPFDGHGAVRC